MNDLPAIDRIDNDALIYRETHTHSTKKFRDHKNVNTIENSKRFLILGQWWARTN